MFLGKSDVSGDLKGETDFARKAEGTLPGRGNCPCKGREARTANGCRKRVW